MPMPIPGPMPMLKGMGGGAGGCVERGSRVGGVQGQGGGREEGTCEECELWWRAHARRAHARRAHAV